MGETDIARWGGPRDQFQDGRHSQGLQGQGGGYRKKGKGRPRCLWESGGNVEGGTTLLALLSPWSVFLFQGQMLQPWSTAFTSWHVPWMPGRAMVVVPTPPPAPVLLVSPKTRISGPGTDVTLLPS